MEFMNRHHVIIQNYNILQIIQFVARRGNDGISEMGAETQLKRMKAQVTGRQDPHRRTKVKIANDQSTRTEFIFKVTSHNSVIMILILIAFSN